MPNVGVGYYIMSFFCSSVLISHDPNYLRIETNNISRGILDVVLPHPETMQYNYFGFHNLITWRICGQLERTGTIKKEIVQPRIYSHILPAECSLSNCNYHHESSKATSQQAIEIPYKWNCDFSGSDQRALLTREANQLGR